MQTSGGPTRKLMITIDVEAQPARAERAHIDRLVWGRFGDAESGMAQLMTAAERRGVRLTTYFDYAEQHLYGDSMLDVARELHRRGHDLQLHLHPEFLSNDFFRQHSTGRVHSLTSVQPADAQLLAAFLETAHREVTGQQALAFRGGGYRFSHTLLRALHEKGVRVDSSYNPSRPTQPVNVGFHKQFQWQGSTFELPVSNVFAFSSPDRHLDYNFNAQALWGTSPQDSAARHRRYLDRFYASYGEDAVAVLVLHSWSLLQRDAAGHYQYAGTGGLERFEALLESLQSYASVIDTSAALSLMEAGALGPSHDLASAEASRDALVQAARDSASAGTAPSNHPAPTPVAPTPKEPACPICGTPVKEFEDFNGPKRRCKGCGAVERQRAFAQLYRGELARRYPLAGKKLLLIAPSSSEKRFLKELGVAQVLTADIRPEVKPDVLADVCDMINVESDSFDVIIASYVLTCVHSLERALAELKRVLKPGGLLLTSDPIARGQATREHKDEKTITDWYGKEAYEKYRVGSFRSFGDQDALALVGRYFRCEAQPTTDIANGSEVVWIVSQKDAGSPGPLVNSDATISRQALRTSGCTVCGNDLKQVEAQQNCPSCQSRARLRALVPVLSDILPDLGPGGEAVGKPLLAFAVTNAEGRQLDPQFPLRRSVSLFGSYAADHESGVDVRDLSRYQDSSFCGVFSSLLFDYFEQHELALAECFRVTAPGGVLLTHLAPYRLLDGHQPPCQAGAIKARPGSFDYLPEGQALPDIKVGREWFLNAMRAAGFAAHLVSVEDSVPGMVSDWFIGVKSSISLAASAPDKALPVHAKPSPARDQLASTRRELFRVNVPFGASGASRLTFEELVLADGPPITLAEDSILPGRGRELVVTDRQRREIYTSSDDGATFRRRYADIDFPQKVRQTFTLTSGHRIVKLDESPLTYLFDQHERLLDIGQTGRWNWAGAQGIGQGPTGTVMFGEYAAFKKGIAMEPLSVWRLRSGAKNWEKVLTLQAGYAPPEGEIRHFHLCSPNPAKPAEWLLSTGDKGRHNRLWTSNDDGDSWQEVNLDGLSLPGVAAASVSGAARLTQINATDDGELVWGSDDKLGIGKAALMAMRLQGRAPTFRHLGFAGPNAVRNVVKLGPSLFMFLCETKEPANEAAECVLLDSYSGKRVTLTLPNLSGQNSTTSDSLGSVCLRDGVGFFPAIGAVLTTSRNGILRFRFEDGESVPERTSSGEAIVGGGARTTSEPSTQQQRPLAAKPPTIAAPSAAAPPAPEPSVARAALSPPHFHCNPQVEYGLTGPTRVCFWDLTRKEFARLCELDAGQALHIPLAAISDTFDLKVKIQIRSQGRWVDQIDYRRVELDAESMQGIRYRYFPRAGTQHLVVIFQAMNTTPGYNYLGTLKDVPASRLYIKDDYGEDPKTRSSYYLGARRSFDVSDGVRNLIREALVDLGLRPRDLVMGGSSKGAFAALFHGYGLNAGHVVAGGPQIMLGKFLNSRSPTSVLPPILHYLAGDASPDSVTWSNNVLFEQIAASSPPYPHVIIHVGEHEPHYLEHVRPLLDWLAARGLPAPILDLGNYNLHADLDRHFPAFFREKVDSIVRRT